MLLNLINTSGKRWKLIAEALGQNGMSSERTPAMVRNRYLRIERGRYLTETGQSKNRCGQCGQLKRGHVCQAPRALVSTSYVAQEAQHEAQRFSSHAPFGGGINIAGGPAMGPIVDYPVLGVNIGSGNPLSMPPPPRTAAPAASVGGPPMLRQQDSMELLMRTALSADISSRPAEAHINDEEQLGNLMGAASAHTFNMSFGGDKSFDLRGNASFSFLDGALGAPGVSRSHSMGMGPPGLGGPPTIGSLPSVGSGLLLNTDGLHGFGAGGLAAALSPGGQAAASCLAAAPSGSMGAPSLRPNPPPAGTVPLVAGVYVDTSDASAVYSQSTYQPVDARDPHEDAPAAKRARVLSVQPSPQPPTADQRGLQAGALCKPDADAGAVSSVEGTETMSLPASLPSSSSDEGAAAVLGASLSSGDDGGASRGGDPAQQLVPRLGLSELGSADALSQTSAVSVEA